jgi:Uma2 family endonuclease
MTLPKENQHYTYADYCSWDDNERWELIDGVSYLMSPAPMRVHQEIIRELAYQLTAFLKGKPCKLFIAPFDVRLNADTYDDTVVQPDLLIVCDRSKLNDKCCVGAPDMVIEILSQSTGRHDKFVKFKLYQDAGVREYWMVDPDTKTVQACTLENGKYITTMYGDTDTASVHILDGCTINLKDVFEE